MEAKQFRRSERKQILTVKWKIKWKKKLPFFIAYILIVLFTLYRRFPLLCKKRDAPCQFQVNCHFHFLKFPTVSSLLHIRKILVHWPFLEKSGPQKWVVGATLALKQNFLAGTLIPNLMVAILLLFDIYQPSKLKFLLGCQLAANSFGLIGTLFYKSSHQL